MQMWKFMKYVYIQMSSNLKYKCQKYAPNRRIRKRSEEWSRERNSQNLITFISFASFFIALLNCVRSRINEEFCVLNWFVFMCVAGSKWNFTTRVCFSNLYYFLFFRFEVRSYGIQRCNDRNFKTILKSSCIINFMVWI